MDDRGGDLAAPALAELTDLQRAEAQRRWEVLRPHVQDGVPLPRAAAEANVPGRSARRWLARYQTNGLAGLVRPPRDDRGARRFPEELRLLVEGLALRCPRPTVAHVHRQAVTVAAEQGWPAPSYGTVYAIVSGIDPAMHTLALEGAHRYRERFDLVFRRSATSPNEIWQADHTELDLWVVTPSGKPARPWLTVIEDDYSRAIAGYALNLGAPTALQTALALRQAIWRKADPGWHVCGIPRAFYTDHGSDFISDHMEQAAADLKIRLVFSLPGQARGRGKIERLFDTINQMCLPTLPGYAPRGTRDRAGQAQLSPTELDVAIGRFIVDVYHVRPHGETGEPPQTRWEAGGWLPRMPDSLEQLDLLLLTVARARKVHPDGIHFLGLRYLDPTLAAFVDEAVTIRYDPRDVTEIRVFYGDRFLCCAVSPELAATTISLRDITTARNQRRRQLRTEIAERARLVDELLGLRRWSVAPSAGSELQTPDRTDIRPRLRRYRDD